MVVDSGATSSFVRPEENIPITGPSSKVVYLPDGSSIQATHSTMLPFDLLSPKARIADVLPGLRPNSLVSVGKLADGNPSNITEYFYYNLFYNNNAEFYYSSKHISSSPVFKHKTV